MVPEIPLAENFTYLFPADNFSLFWADLSQVTDSTRAGGPVSLLSLSFLHSEEGGRKSFDRISSKKPRGASYKSFSILAEEAAELGI